MERRRFDYLAGRKGNVYSTMNYDIQSFPKDLDRKVYLLTYFEEYMSRTLERDVDWVHCDTQRHCNMDFLVKYQRLKNAIVFKLSNDVVQVSLRQNEFARSLAEIPPSSTSSTTPRFF